MMMNSQVLCFSDEGRDTRHADGDSICHYYDINYLNREDIYGYTRRQTTKYEFINIRALPRVSQIYSPNYYLESYLSKIRFYIFIHYNSFSILCVHSREPHSLSLASEKSKKSDVYIYVSN
jgi:hypothetical protein